MCPSDKDEGMKDKKNERKACLVEYVIRFKQICHT